MTRSLALLAVLLGMTLAARAQAPDTLTVVTLNIWHDQGDWPSRLDHIERELKRLRPDVVMLQEVIQRATLPNQAQSIADRLGMPFVHFVSIDSVGSPKRYGNAIVSRYPLAETGTLFMPPLDAYRMAAYAVIDVAGQPVHLYATHLHNPPTTEGRGARAMEIAHLLDWVAETAGDDALIIGGDFNAEPDWPEMGMMRDFRDLGGAGATFGHQQDTPRRRIDYLFDNRHPGLVPLAAGVALDRPGADGQHPSDHFAVYARFLLP